MCNPLPVKNLSPVNEVKIACQEQASSLVSLCKHLKQKLRAAPTEGQIAEFINDQQISAVELSQESIDVIELLFLFEQIDQGGRCHFSD